MKYFKSFLFAGLLVLATVALATGSVFASVKVAFIGDQGVGEDARNVLSLIAAEGTDLLMIQGDLGYAENTASLWEANLTHALGANFPVLTLVGNHENYEWAAYQEFIKERINRAEGLSCEGNEGVKSVCRFANIDVAQVSPGINEVAGVEPQDDYEQFLRDSFEDSGDRWRICSWHKNQRDMQTGNKGDSTGWGVFDACLDMGAMVAMAHEHAYSRTYLLSDYESQTVVHTNSDMVLEPGKSFAFVSGLGGHEVRPQVRGGDWFASIYTATQGATHGALFCDFGARSAECYFKAIDGAIPDEFTLQLGREEQVMPEPEPEEPVDVEFTGGFVFSRTDKTEYRWVDQNSSGVLGSIWIDKTCADTLGGSWEYGGWHELMVRAPGFDTIGNPCISAEIEASNAALISFDFFDPDSPGGYVFSRSDKQELRWIARNASGEWGSVWISEACADELGGATATGDWGVLIKQAPGFDSVPSPCQSIQYLLGR